MGRRSNLTEARLPVGLAAAIKRFAATDVLVAFDFDGVLAPIVSDRAHARVPQTVCTLVKALSGCYPCAVISGRSLSDLAPRVHGLGLTGVYGNFGYEPTQAATPRSARIERWATRLRSALSGEEGVEVEDKGWSLAVHYRRATRPTRARTSIARVVRTLRGARSLNGTLAITVLPGSQRHKGTALQRALREARCRTAIYLGDDGTDEDAFGSAPPSRLLAVRVGGRGPTRAAFTLPSQADVPTFLRHLLSARRDRVLEGSGVERSRARVARPSRGRGL